MFVVISEFHWLGGDVFGSSIFGLDQRYVAIQRTRVVSRVDLDVGNLQDVAAVVLRTAPDPNRQPGFQLPEEKILIRL
jgi:hypothetical protein